MWPRFGQGVCLVDAIVGEEAPGGEPPHPEGERGDAERADDSRSGRMTTDRSADVHLLTLRRASEQGSLYRPAAMTAFVTLSSIEEIGERFFTQGSPPK